MPQHILHIAPTPFFSDRGCHIRIEGIVRCFKNLGYENTVCTYHHGRDIKGVTSKRISTIKNYTQTAAGPSKYKLWADWKLFWLVVKEFNRIKPTAIHAHLHEGVLIGVLLKVMFFWNRTPLIADMQGSLSGELETHGSFKKLPFLRAPVRVLERVLLMFPRHTVCSSKHSLEKIRSEFGVAENKITLVQDGADEANHFTALEKDNFKQTLGLPKSKPVLVYSGALLDAKGLTELKQIIKGVAQRNDELHFLIIGYPTESLDNFLASENLTNRCTLTGRVNFESLHSYLQSADMAIDPKRSDAGEGSGKMLNYIACGLPVVAFNSQNNSDFLPKGSPLADSMEQLVEKILELSNNTSLREEFAKSNQQQFEDHYSWSVSQKQLQKAYHYADID